MIKQTKILDLFRSRGKPQTLLSSQVFPLSKKGAIFAFEEGSFNLFAIERTGNIRRFLTPLAGPLLFYLSEAAEQNLYDIAIVSSEKTTLYELSEKDVEQALARDPSLSEEFLLCLRKWFSSLFHCFTKQIPEGHQTTIFPPEPLSLFPNQFLVFTKSLHMQRKEEEVWIEVVKGTLLLYGEENLALTPQKPPFLLTGTLWFRCTEATQIRAIDSSSLLREKLWGPSLALFDEFFNRGLPHLLAARQQTERQVLTERIEEQEQNLDLAVKQMESVLAPSPVPILKKTQDALQYACQLIGNYLKIDFVFSRKALASTEMEEKLNLICSGSQINKRKITLKQGWWKKDLGPLLGFYGEEKKPVALLNPSPLKYEMVDSSKKTAVNSSIAQNISKTAYMFYTPLPPEIKTGRQLVNFFFKNHHKLPFMIFIFSLLGGIISFFSPIATNLLFKYAVPENNASLISYLTLGMIFSAIGFMSFYFMRNFAFLKLEGLGTHFIQASLWDRLLKLSPNFFRRYSVGNLFWRISSIEEIRMLISGNASTLGLAGIFSLMYIIMMLVYAPLLAIIAIGFTLLGLAVTAFYAFRKIDILRKSLEIQGKIRGFVIQMIGGVGKLRVAGAEKNAFSYWASFFSQDKTLQLQARTAQNIVSTVAIILPMLTMWSVYATLIGWLGLKSISLPNFLAFNIALGSYVQSVYPLFSTVIQLVDIFPLWERTKVILEEPMEEEKRKSDPGKLAGEIWVDSVVFGYDPDRPPILNNISIRVEPRELIGIVGPSGCGKSTLLRLLLGFEKPQSGGIYYDGKDLASLDPRSVRRQLGLVLQGESLMAGTMYDNLVCGGLFPPEQIEYALDFSGFTKDLESFPMGLHTYIPMNGATLSGGQKQRLLLARALLIRPSFLMLDEATSALDNRTQEMITKNIRSINISRIVIAQRLSTVRNADRIYVLEKGSVAQSGTYEELAAAPGLFAEMLARQKL